MSKLRQIFLTLAGISLCLNLFATEGMWIPSLLKAMNEDDLYSMGLEIPVEAIYSVNEGSLKDAIVLFGGGCTAEIISPNGLMLTNHHCGYSQIQSHSSVENDYLKHGFWAGSFEEELPNPRLTATFVVRMDDVTDAVYNLMNELMEKQGMSQGAAASQACKDLAAQFEGGKGLRAEVKPFNFGNSYFQITTRTFEDVRLVGAPPSAIGKFGGDTDNWVWPRHTGDFSLFRIYADANNEPAAYSEENQAYRAPVHLPVSLNGVEEGDFCMVFGFPGFTEQYLIADAVEHVVSHLNPGRIGMRDESLSVINAAMLSSDELRIKYAAKQSSIANAWKKWIGQNQGLVEVGALDIKQNFEKEYLDRAAAMGESDYANALLELRSDFPEFKSLLEARSYLIEYVFYGPEIFRFTNGFRDFVENYEQIKAEGKDKEQIERLKAMIRGHFKNLDPSVDKELFERLSPLFIAHTSGKYSPESFVSVLSNGKGGMQAAAERIYNNSVFADSTRLMAQLDKFSGKTAKKWKNDPAFQATTAIYDWFFKSIQPAYAAEKQKQDDAMKRYVKGMMELFSEKNFWYDANSTLRLTYGKVEGSSPWDGMTYDYYTTAEGILQKYKPDHPDFELPADLIEKLEARDYGVYAHSDGELRVCFTGSNHTTGGNSGSPAINSKGELIGLNFDRSWESTMSDIMFDASRCRNIMVDIRYVLWVIDKYAGATRLIDEMTLVKGPAELPETDNQ